MRPITPENDPGFFRVLGALAEQSKRAHDGETVTRRDLIMAGMRAVYPGKTDAELEDIIRAELAKRGKAHLWARMVAGA